MSARKATRRPKAPEPMPTRDEYAAIAITAVRDGQERAVKRTWFCEGEHGLPIGGTPRPIPCPFCGTADDIILVIRDGNDSKGNREISAHCECQVCGTEAPGASTLEDDSLCRSLYGVALRAAQIWNTRPLEVKP